MCGYCNDLDDYEARHGHECDDDCATFCDECGMSICMDEAVDVDDLVACDRCANLIGAMYHE